MPGRRGFTRDFRPGRSRRTSQWLFGPDSVAQVFASTTRGIWTTGISSGLNQTIVRTRGVVGLTLTAGSQDDGFFGAIGFGLVAENAFAAGASSCPSAFLDADWDGWLWHTFFDIRGWVTGLVPPHQSIVIDSKAMRKWEGDEMTLFGSTDVVETGVASLTVNADTRVLVKLP